MILFCFIIYESFKTFSYLRESFKTFCFKTFYFVFLSLCSMFLKCSTVGITMRNKLCGYVWFFIKNKKKSFGLSQILNYTYDIKRALQFQHYFDIIIRSSKSRNSGGLRINKEYTQLLPMRLLIVGLHELCDLVWEFCLEIQQFVFGLANSHV